MMSMRYSYLQKLSIFIVVALFIDILLCSFLSFIYDVTIYLNISLVLIALLFLVRFIEKFKYKNWTSVSVSLICMLFFIIFSQTAINYWFMLNDFMFDPAFISSRYLVMIYYMKLLIIYGFLSLASLSGMLYILIPMYRNKDETVVYFTEEYVKPKGYYF